MAATCCFLFFALLALACATSCTASKVAQEAAPPEPEPEKPPTNPLTGEVVSSPELITRRPLAVKVENDPQARPQSGIVDADLVYEELVEGGVTRFICVYLSKDPAVIGPCRSARPSDVDICYYLDPLLACSGGERRVVASIRASGMLYIEEDKSHFWRDRSRRAPHNLYTSSALLRQYLAELGDTYKGLPDSGLAFMELTADAAESQELEGEPEEAEQSTEGRALWLPATSLEVLYKMSACAASYQYDPASDAYLHSINGAPHHDRTTGGRVAPRNVIVQTVKLTGSGIKDVTGSETPLSQVIGSGKCLVFSGGRVCCGTWRKDNRYSPTLFLDSGGNPITLRPGQTWIHLVSEDIQTSYR